jgi:cell division control protein 6
VSLNSYASVVILDELDHIAKTPALLDDLFALTHEHKQTIRIIGIANTHTLTAFSVKAGSGSGVQTLHFSAYTGQQLVEIVQSRLEPLYEEAEQAAAMKKLLPVPALMLLAKKIAAQTGDVRAVFEVLRGAIDLAVVESAVIAAPAVTPKHVLSALKLYAPTTSQTAMPTGISAASGPAANSELAMQVRQLGLHARVVLLALVLATRRSQCGLPLIGSASNTHASPTKSPVKRAGSATALPSANAGMVEAGALHAFYAATLARGDSVAFTPVSRSEFADLLGMLETVGLVALSSAGGTPGSPSKSGRRALGRAASFGGAKTTVAAGAQEARIADGVRLDEVLLGLGCTGGQLDTPAGADPREEELRALWGREQARITREAKTRPAGAQTDVFTEATED